MIRSLLFFILICKFTYSVAQYEPQFSQNMFNQSSVNPGFAGSSGRVAVTALTRNVDKALMTTVFSADAGLKMLGHEHGVGVNFRRDEIGALMNIRYTLAYAYKIDIGEGQLGAGMSVGLLSTTLKVGDLYTDPSKNIRGNSKALGKNDYHIADDPLLSDNDVSDACLDLGWGVFYKEKKWYSGFSVIHMNQPGSKLNENLNFEIKRTWFLTGGYTFDIEDKPFQIEPSLFMKTDGSITQIDLAALVKYNKRFWGGLGYRLQDAVIVYLGMELKNGLKVGYSYDITVSHQSGFQTHEVMLAYWFSLGVSKKSKQYRSVRYL